MKRFIISIANLKDDEEQRFNSWIGQRAQWWHWLPNLWLVVDQKGELNCSGIRGGIKESIGWHVGIVIEVEPKDWAAGTMKDDKGNDMATWLRSSWDPDPI